jgi:hypothetical protein
MGKKQSSVTIDRQLVSRRRLIQIGGLAVPAALLSRSWIPAFAQTTTFDYYIGPSGSDSNPGTASSPWSINALNTKQSTYAGKKVGLLDGTYNVNSLVNARGGGGYACGLQVQGGSSGSPTVIAAVNRLRAIIQANSGSSYPGNNPVLGSYGASQRGHITIDGIKFTGSSTKCLYFGDYGAASQGSRFDGITIKNCELTGSNATSGSLPTGNNLSLLELAGARGALIQNNYFHDNIGKAANDTDHFSSTLQWYSVDCVYEYNTFVKSPGMYGKENGNTGTVIRYNHVDLSSYGGADTTAVQDFIGVVSDRGNALDIHHNVLIGGKAIDFRPTLGTAYSANRVNVYNNTMLTTNFSGHSGGVIGRTGTGLFYCYNNIIQLVGSGDHMYVCTNVDAPGLLDYNLYYKADGQNRWATNPDKTSNNRANVTTLSSFLGGLTNGLLTSVTTLVSLSPVGKSPAFVASGTEASYYKLSSTSPAKGAGRVGGVSSGAATDLGAWGNSAPSRIGCDLDAADIVRPQAPVIQQVT